MAPDPVNTGAAADVARPQPTDAPGAVAGWTKLSADGPGGWSAIDDVPGGADAGWQQT